MEGCDVNVRIEFQSRLLCHQRFRSTDMLPPKQKLPVEITYFYCIQINLQVRNSKIHININNKPYHIKIPTINKIIWKLPTQKGNTKDNFTEYTELLYWSGNLHCLLDKNEVFINLQCVCSWILSRQDFSAIRSQLLQHQQPIYWSWELVPGCPLEGGHQYLTPC